MLYAKSGELISGAHELIFDYSSESPRSRQQQITLLLTREANECNNREVLLKLEEKLKDTSYSQSNMKRIQRDWDEFFAASVSVGTASQKNLSHPALLNNVSILFRIDYITPSIIH